MTLIGDIGPEGPSPLKRFQSLFSWMTLIGTQAAGAHEVVNVKFQSLFSWMTLIGDPVFHGLGYEI